MNEQVKESRSKDMCVCNIFDMGLIQLVNWTVPNSLCGCSIANQVLAHVLHDLLTVVVGVCTRVLVGPLQREHRASVVVQTAYVVAASVVVL